MRMIRCGGLGSLRTVAIWAALMVWGQINLNSPISRFPSFPKLSKLWEMVNESYTLTTLRLFSRYSETMATWTVVVGNIHSYTLPLGCYILDSDNILGKDMWPF